MSGGSPACAKNTVQLKSVQHLPYFAYLFEEYRKMIKFVIVDEHEY